MSGGKCYGYIELQWQLNFSIKQMTGPMHDLDITCEPDGPL